MFTSHRNEVETTTTTPKTGDVYTLLIGSWPELNEEGALSLTAQFWHETGSGKHCYNWNLGNVKAGVAVPHMYLKNVWEVFSGLLMATELVARTPGQAHVATVTEIRDHGWPCPPGKAIVVFQPPHEQCRFRAYASLADGAAKWIEHHQRIAAQNPDYLAQLNAGDLPAIARSLKLARYYTAGEEGYAAAMVRSRVAILKARDA